MAKVISLFECLPACDQKSVDELVAHAQEVQFFEKGQEIPLSPTHIWVVQRGLVILNTLSWEGEYATLGLAGARDWFGLSMTRVRPYYAVAVEPTAVLKLDRVDVSNSGVLTQRLFESTQARLQQAELLLCVLSQSRTEGRLRQLLSLLAEEFGQTSAQGIQIPFRLTHQQLAMMIGSSRVTVTRLLLQLRREGFLTMQRKQMLLAQYF